MRIDADVIVDRMRIQDVIIRYGDALDDGDVDGVLRCFHTDATVSYRDGEIVVRGRDELRDLLKSGRGGLLPATHPDVASTHCMTNIRVLIDGSCARSSTTAHVTMVGTGQRSGVTLQNGVRYIDEFVRVGSEWLISRRQHRTVWSIESK